MKRQTSENARCFGDKVDSWMEWIFLFYLNLKGWFNLEFSFKMPKYNITSISKNLKKIINTWSIRESPLCFEMLMSSRLMCLLRHFVFVTSLCRCPADWCVCYVTLYLTDHLYDTCFCILRHILSQRSQDIYIIPLFTLKPHSLSWAHLIVIIINSAH